MKKEVLTSLVISFLFVFSFSCSKTGKVVESGNAYSDERSSVLGRGLVSYAKDGGHVYLCWRLLPEDTAGVTFNIYRKGMNEKDEKFKKIGTTNRTFLVDRDAGGKRYSYAVRTVQEGMEGTSSAESIALSNGGGKPALVFEIGKPYKQARVVTGDLNGDGEPEIVVAYSGYQNVDPYGKAWSKSEDTIKVSAFLPGGDRLWTIDLGQGIESGEDYQPMVVWDLDGDGRAEVILKTNKSGDPLDYPSERLTVLDGMTGRVKNEAKWPSLPWSPGRKTPGDLSRLDKGVWSDYNNDSRNYLAIAHLDGNYPFVIAARGTYKAQRIWAFDRNLDRVWERNVGLDHHYVMGVTDSPMTLRDRLEKFWSIRDKTEYLRKRFSRKLTLDQHRGTHSLPIADVDGDGKEEIFWGELCIGEKGKDLWAIKEKFPYPGHLDLVFPADIDPSRRGKEIFYGREGGGEESEWIGVYMVDYKGNIVWSHWGYHHIDRGWVSKIVSGQKGLQCLAIDLTDKLEKKAGAWTLVEPLGLLYNSEGILLGNPSASLYSSFPADWNGDGIREIVFTKDGTVQKFGGPVLGKLSMESLWGADLFGDRREEIVAAPGDGKIYIFFNMGVLDIIPKVTALADRQYRNDLSRTAMQANGPPMEGGFIPEK